MRMKRPNNTPLAKSLLASLAFITLGWGKALAQDAMLFEQVEDNAASRLLRETLVDMSAGVVLDMSPVVHEALRNKNLGSWELDLPCPPEFKAEHNTSSWHLELTRFFAHPEIVTVGITTDRGLEEMDYIPQLQSFRVTINGRAVGSLTLMTDHVVGSFHQHGRQYDVMHKAGNRYVLADMNQLRHHEPFECGVVDSDALPVRQARAEQPSSQRVNGGCVEIALDLDQVTWNTFNNVDNATEWALAMMAGVEAIYTEELNGLALLQVSYVHIWQTEDPMNAFVQDAGGMLDSFRDTWENSNLDEVQRDITHLISKRTNTGTGGIAWLDVNCGSFAYGFSANLNPTTNYNINSYSWNLDVVSHELGHNFGANHTHWCGWPGGAIDNCSSAEGGCGDGPSVGSGTIMSYCHTTSTGKTLEFHPLVETYALEPGIEDADCYTGCEQYTPPECAIATITAGDQMACDPLTGLYSQQIVVEFDYPPTEGFLNVNGANYSIDNSPRLLTLVGEPANGESADVTAYFTMNEGCALSVPDVYTRRDPCCGNLRLTYVDPENHTLRIRNVADCPTNLSEWGLLTEVVPVLQLLPALIDNNQDTWLEPGEEFELTWDNALAGDWLLLSPPTTGVHDYVQWGPNGDPIYFSAYDELATIWPTGADSFIQDDPPYMYTGDGSYGVSEWSGEQNCVNDVNGNGAVDVADVLLVLSDFGCAVGCNDSTDIDGDGGVTVSDVLSLLSTFGQGC